jgi:tetratricopeptide (TPR) repeat protein
VRAAGPLGEVELARVVERADGNALLALELARATARGDPDLPASLHDAARTTLASLPGEARRLTELLAVAGRDLHRDALERLPVDDWVASAGEALDCGLLVSSGGRLGFRHAVLREAVYAEVAEPRRARLHAEVAGALAGSGRAAEVAHHLRSAGRDADAVRHLARAAAHARRVAALDDAAGFLREALASAPDDTGLLLELGEIEAWRGRSDPARAAFGRAVASLPAHDLTAQALAWLRRGRAFRGALCLPRESHAAYREALSVLGPDAGERPEALAGLAWAEAVAGDVRRVDPLLCELEELVGGDPADDRLALDVGLARGHAMIRRGRFAESYAPLIAAAEAGRTAGRPDLAYTCWINASSAAACAGDFEGALAFADRCRLAARHAGLLPLEANALSARAHILVRLGRCDDALHTAAEAREIADRLDSAPLRATAAHDAGIAHRAAGDYAGAADLMAEALAGDAAVSRPLARLARAEALARLGRLAEAEAELDETALEPVRAGDFPATLVARLAFVQALIATARGDVALARRRLEESVDGWRRAAGAPPPGEEYMRVMVDLGRPPVAGLVEPAREQARAEAELTALPLEVSA